jgi:acyl transferase domain-containing protein
VRQPAARVYERLPEALDIATVNGPSLCVVSGPSEAVAAFKEQLEADGVACSVLVTSHAFHSRMMEPVVEPFTRAVEQVQLRPPRIPILSAVTRTWLTPEQATDPSYWSRHLRQPVLFSDAVAELLKDPAKLLLEVGPRATLATLARQHLQDRSRVRVLATLGEAAGADFDWGSILTAAGQLWLSGVPLHFDEVHRHERRRRVALPTYPFERRRYWLPALPRRAGAEATTQPPAMPEERPQPAPSPQVAAVMPGINALPTASLAVPPAGSPAQVQSLIDRQLAIMRQQLAVLSGARRTSTTTGLDSSDGGQETDPRQSRGFTLGAAQSG